MHIFVKKGGTSVLKIKTDPLVRWKNLKSRPHKIKQNLFL